VTASPDPLLSDVRYLPYLPLVYVAWADGELDRAEAQRVRDLASRELAPGIDDQPVLATWLDPDQPPSAARLLSLRRRMRAVGVRVPPAERRCLADLGLALARAEGEEPLPSVDRAVRELEDALGVSGVEAVWRLGIGTAALPAPAAAPSEPSFDVGAMARLLDGRDHRIRNEVRDLLASGVLVRPAEIDMAGYRELTLTWLRELADRGFGRRTYPGVTTDAPDLGGFVAALEVLAEFDLSLVIKLGVQFGLFGGSIYFLGTDEHHALLPDIASTKLLGCFAMTELGHGSNVAQLGTTADLDRATDSWIVHTPDEASRKEYIGNAACHGRLAVVFAQLRIDDEGYGVHAFLVPIRTDDGAPAAGVRIGDCGHKMGLNGVDNGRLWFDRVRIPRTSLLNRFGTVDADGTYESPIASPTKRFFSQISTLVGGRIAIASAAVAAARSALAIAIRYGDRRRQFGPAGGPETRLLDYRTHQLRLLPRLARAYALTVSVRDLVDRWIARDATTSRELEARAAALKAAASWFATETIQECREACGGAGYLSENRFAALKADTDVFTTFEGDNTVLMQLAARGVLTAFKVEIGDGRVGNIVRHLADRAAAGLRELDPITSRLTGSSHLRSADLHRDLLHHRQDKLTWSVAGRLRSRMARGMDGFAAALECQDHLVALAHAYADRCEVDAFAAVVDSLEEGPLRTTLERLAALHALDRVRSDEAWFLRHGTLEPGKSRAIRDEVHALCAELRPSATALVAAFAIPEVVLGAPIASS
jgi:acyl-CoA oxidase